MKWLWIGGGLLFAVIAGTIWLKFGNPQWVSAFVLASATSIGVAIWDKLKPGFLKMLEASEATIAENQRRQREGEGPKRVGKKEKPKPKEATNWKGGPK